MSERLDRMLDVAGVARKTTFRLDEVQKILACSESTVRRMIEDGSLIAIKLRTARRVTYASLEDLVNEGKCDE